MTKKIISIFAIVLTLAIMVGCLASCEIGPSNNKNTTSSSSNTDKASTVSQSTSITSISTTDPTTTDLTTTTFPITETTTQPITGTTVNPLDGINAKVLVLEAKIAELDATIDSLKSYYAKDEEVNARFADLSKELADLKTDMSNLKKENASTAFRISEILTRLQTLEKAVEDSMTWKSINGYDVYGNDYTILRTRRWQIVTVDFHSKTLVDPTNKDSERIKVATISYIVPYTVDTLIIGTQEITPNLESATNFVYTASGNYTLNADNKLCVEITEGTYVVIDPTLIPTNMYNIIKADFAKSYCTVGEQGSVIINK